MTKNKKTELLAPAGSIEAARVAINNGADAVYLGGKSFSARNLADNFDDDALAQIIDFAHLRGVKVYVAANTLYTAAELPQVLDFLHSTYEMGADAFIMQDLGAMRLAKKLLPNIEYYASTQMGVHDLGGVKYLAQMGFDRVILARELSIEAIESIAAASPIPVEVFVHGALCYCYSGMCLMSSLIGKRSGNRGNCAQSCRRLYSLEKGRETVAQGYLMSPKDLAGADFVRRLSDAGIAALKIEGRMKSAEYVAQATKTYRGILDETEGFDRAAELGKTAQIFSRGLTSGYFDNYANANMMSYTSPKPIGALVGKVMSYDVRRGYGKFFVEKELIAGDGIGFIGETPRDAGCYMSKSYEAGEIGEFFARGAITTGDSVYKSYDKGLNDELAREIARDVRKLEVQARVRAIAGEKLALALDYGEIKAVTLGPVVQEAKNQPLSAERVLEQLNKTGDTPFHLNFSKTDIGDNIFVPMKDLNEVRRQALAEFEQELLHSKWRQVEPPELDAQFAPLQVDPSAQELKLCVQVRNLQQFRGVMQAGVTRIYYEANGSLIANIDRISQDCKNSSTELFAALPAIIDDGLTELVNTLESSEINGYLVSNYGHLNILANTKKTIAIDYGMNVHNPATASLFHQNITPSAESTFTEIRQMGANANEIIVHGKLAAMHTRQCPAGLYAAEKSGKNCKLRGATGYALRDEKGAKFQVICNCNLCFATILNSKPIFMLDKLDQIPESCRYARILLWDEDMAEAFALAETYGAALKGTSTLSAKDVRADIEKGGYTFGYYFGR